MLPHDNPSGSSLTLRQLDTFGGRPPDGIPMIPPLQSLERPSSPTQLEGESVMKKVRSSVDVVVDSDRVAMDTDNDTGMDSDVRYYCEHSFFASGSGSTFSTSGRGWWHLCE
ncbi:hypothetical protein V6N11_050133 [Hibiscus sabdariffa]|uniref:Uncharacterized protein n=1 Tax=Hibiscus sabdariffa TaxID=183260 RepID=A0ABR2T9T9_9ROSI